MSIRRTPGFFTLCVFAWYSFFLPFLGSFSFFIVKYSAAGKQDIQGVIGGAFVAAIFATLLSLLFWVPFSGFVALISSWLFSRRMKYFLVAFHAVLILAVPWIFVSGDSYLSSEKFAVFLVSIVFAALTCSILLHFWNVHHRHHQCQMPTS
jgi:hypothetical protein